MKHPNVRATEAGLRALADFANTGNTLQDWRVFFKNHPGFVPQETETRLLEWPWDEPKEKPVPPAEVALLLRCRNDLRDVWTGQEADGSKLAALLGGSIEGAYLLELFPADLPGDWRFTLNWQKGTVEYQTGGSPFHEALWRLFQNSWRARVCPQCGSYFVARRPPQRFCSTDCRDIVNRESKLAYYREVGRERRQKRNRQLMKSKQRRQK